ncbi:hypothetical protein [Neobacillus muris]|uniref:hypothetical protein n=1 Tax=Neobacillus muris TaxID=2941334 RepID=UPI002041D3CF|nr:hypothetical protein [Neobacillus muris]
MNDNQRFYDLERKIRSLPEPDYDQKYTKEVQDAIHETILQFARSYDQKKKRAGIMKKISVGLASIAALLLFAIITFPIHDDSPSQSGSTEARKKSEEPISSDKNSKNPDTEDHDQNKPDENMVYENTEYGFTFSLPKSWEGYQIVSDSWEGVSADQQPMENGPILLIRHPDWTEDNPRQDIPIMVFTMEQWSSLQNEEFHIGAAPIGPKMLGQNKEYVFALPARYNFAFLEGYEEVESILKNEPLQPSKEE